MRECRGDSKLKLVDGGTLLMGALVLNVGVQNMKKVIWNGIIIYNIMYGIVDSEGVMYW